MPLLKTYDLFISHAWKYEGDYDHLVALLENAPFFKFRNYSAPPTKPLILPPNATKELIRRNLENKIRPVNAFIILGGMYYNYHDWLQEELQQAVKYGKPIIAVYPRGNQVMPAEIQRYAKTCVHWNTQSIIDAIRTYAL